MYQHLFIMGTDYKLSQRIAVHFSYKDKLQKKDLIQLNKIKEHITEYSLDIIPHRVETKRPSIESVIEMDPYFKGVHYIDSTDEFLKIITESHKINALDVANYILSSKEGCTHLTLQKLIYFCYENYLLKTGMTLFPEPIAAFKYGPVVREVYGVYKKFGSDPIDSMETETHFSKSDRPLSVVDQSGKNITKSTLFSKFLSMDSGLEMIDSIEFVLQKYGDKSSSNLVDESHKLGGPWHIVYYGNHESDIISPELILKTEMKKIY